MNVLTSKPGLVKITSAFALGGGLGIPAFFLALGALLHQPSLRDSNSMFHLFGWFDSFRVMLWPSWLFSLAAGEVTTWIHFAIGVLLNVMLYGVIGLVAGAALRSRTAQVILMTVLVAGLYAMNSFWSDHMTSFFAAAVIVISFLAAFFWKLGTHMRAN